MSNAITLEQAEKLTAQLPPREQLWLVARISERLSKLELTASETVASPTGQDPVQECDWASLRGIAPDLLEGQEAQSWVSHSRHEANDQREQQ